MTKITAIKFKCENLSESDFSYLIPTDKGAGSLDKAYLLIKYLAIGPPTKLAITKPNVAEAIPISS